MIFSDGTVVPLRYGWRAWVYRGKRRARRHRIGHLATGLAFFTAVNLR